MSFDSLLFFASKEWDIIKYRGRGMMMKDKIKVYALEKSKLVRDT